VRLDVEIGGDPHGEKVREASVAEGEPSGDGEDHRSTLHAAPVDEPVEVVAVDRREMDPGVGRGQVELSLTEGSGPFADDGAGNAGLPLRGIERRVVDVREARAGGRDRIGRGDRARQRGSERRELQVIEAGVAEDVGDPAGESRRRTKPSIGE
jgi:hypothetical protein